MHRDVLALLRLVCQPSGMPAQCAFFRIGGPLKSRKISTSNFGRFGGPINLLIPFYFDNLAEIKKRLHLGMQSLCFFIVYCVLRPLWRDKACLVCTGQNRDYPFFFFSNNSLACFFHSSLLIRPGKNSMASFTLSSSSSSKLAIWRKV